MRIFILTIFVISICPLIKAKEQYSDEVKHTIKQLRIYHGLEGEPEVGGSAVGYSGEPHPTYILIEYIRRVGKLSDFKVMLMDKDPVVRVVGAYSLVSNKRFLFLEEEMKKLYYEKVDYEQYWKREMEIRKKYLEDYTSDSSPIVVGPGGCIFEKRTVGYVIKKMIANPHYFEFDAEQFEGNNSE